MFSSLSRRIRSTAADFVTAFRSAASSPPPPSYAPKPQVPFTPLRTDGIVGAGSTLSEGRLELARSQYNLRETGYHLPSGEGVAVQDIVVPQDMPGGTVRRHSWIAGQILGAIKRFKKETGRTIGELEMNMMGYSKNSEIDERSTDRVVIRNTFTETDAARKANPPSITPPPAGSDGERSCERFNGSRFGSFASNGRVADNGWGVRVAYRAFHLHSFDQFEKRLDEYARWRATDLENFRGCQGLGGGFSVSVSTNTIPGVRTLDVLEVERFFTPPLDSNPQYRSRRKASGVREPFTPVELMGEEARKASSEMERGYRDPATGDVWRVVCWRAPPPVGDNYSLTEQLARYTDLLAESQEKYGGRITGFSPSVQRGAKWKQHEVGEGANAPGFLFVTLIRCRGDGSAPFKVDIPSAPRPMVGCRVMEAKAENVSNQNMVNMRGVVDKTGRGWAIVEDFTEPLRGDSERSYEEQWDNLLRLIMLFYKEQSDLGRDIEVIETSLSNVEDAAFMEPAAHGHRRRVTIRFQVKNFDPSMATTERPLAGATLRDGIASKIRNDNAASEEGYLGEDGDGAALIQYTPPRPGANEIGVRPSQYQFLLYLNDWGNNNPGLEIVDFNYWMSWDHHMITVDHDPGFSHLMLLHVKEK